MAFFLRSSDLTVIDTDTAEGYNKDFSDALENDRAEAVASLQKTASSVTDDQVSLAADGKITINNADFVTEISKMMLMSGGSLIKNAGCGGGC
ncbi:hypothetical protein GOC49_11975 [Sinorhizobium meliloti]|nr:hypothetical protein [Sinorhizobium meliloti]MDX0587044.1 hypothetical protein [Sinorhizobium medicae]